MLLVWLLIRWQRVRDDRLLLVLGVVIGIAAMTKFQVMLCLVLLVAIAVCGPRDLLGRPLLGGGGTRGAGRRADPDLAVPARVATAAHDARRRG
jgi:hypothetical protein